MLFVQIISTCYFGKIEAVPAADYYFTFSSLQYSCSVEEDWIAIDFVLVEIFHVVYRAIFFDSGFFVRRDSQLFVKPQFISFPSAPNWIKGLGIARKQYSCSIEEDCITIDFVLVEIFQAVYGANFFDRGFFVRRDSQLSVTPQFIRFRRPDPELMNQDPWNRQKICQTR
jgi:hypothetical protein